MGTINIKHTGSGADVSISSDGTSLLLNGTAVGGGALELYAENPSTPTAPSATGTNAVAVGNGSTASGDYANSFGTGTAGGNYSTAVGTSAYSQGLSSFAAGSGAWSGANYSTAIGRGFSGSATTATGSGAMALGGSYASGTDSFAAAIANNTASYGATGLNSIAMGSLAKATGNSSVAIGTSNTASGVGSICIGSTGASIASGTNSVAIGNQATASGSGSVVISSNGTGWGSDATAGSSFALGDGAVSTIKGKFAFSSGSATVSKGLMQAGMIVLTQVTSSISPNTLNSYNYSASGTNNQVILPNNSAFAFHGVIVARQQASLGTGCAAWKIEGLIRREGSAGTTVLVNSATTILDNTPAWGMILSADTTNGGLAITVIGAATNIRWVATINTSEVTY